MKKYYFLLFILPFLFSTCKKDDDSSPAINDTPAGDSIALLDIYNIAFSEPYNAVVGWDISLPMNQWEDVELDENRRVVSFSLYTVYVKEQLPLSIRNLTKLQRVKLGVKKETPFPSHILALTNLEDLSLDGFGGDIPKELGKLVHLTGLVLTGTHTGPIPKELGNLTKLYSLIIMGQPLYGGDIQSGHFLSGSIPKELGNLTNLISLGIHGGVTGSIPEELTNLTQLQHLSLSGNRLSGTIPEEFANLTQLSSLYLSHNQLSGTIPQALLDRFGDQPNVFCPQVGTNFDNYDCNLAP